MELEITKRYVACCIIDKNLVKVTKYSSKVFFLETKEDATIFTNDVLDALKRELKDCTIEWYSNRKDIIVISYNKDDAVAVIRDSFTFANKIQFGFVKNYIRVK